MARFFLNRNKQRLFKTTLSACSAIAYSPAATVRLRHLKLQTILRRLFYASVIALSQPTFADTRCDNKAATLESVEGVVEWTTTDDHWQPAARGETFCYGDKIRVLEQRAALRLANDTIVRLRENSVVTLLPEDKGFWVELLQGAGHFLSRTPKQLTIKAAYLNAAIDGTEFVVTTEEQSNRVAVFEGDVRVFNRYGEVRLGEGTETTATATTAPDPARSIRLRDAAEWILHYPPLIIQNQTLTGVSPLIDQERYGEALNALTQQTMTSGAAALAASLALVAGQPSEADRLLGIALQQNPQSADALALKTLKTLTAGDDQTALLQTTRLLQTDPQNVSVLLAHAYALQSQGKIEEALKINRQALSLIPDNLFILARTAELELSAGNIRAARKLIDRALQKAPTHSRVNTLAGFIALNRFANKEAQTYFRTAINSNDSEPLARLGLALALIQKGKIEQGRAEMEMAVLLDPGSSLLRSYLGKTYAAQDQNDWADTQYQLAKNLDPNDPTPWFYEGLKKQQVGNLISAVKSFEKSRELNDNRAVYRSRQYLDKDSASRAASVGRAYNTLGFTQQAIDIGAKAISEAPGEHSGHRLLAEVYAKDNRYESLRSSERLQATMLQPLGTEPLPLGLSETGLLIIDGAGPADLGVNEYNRLFVQEGINGRVTGLAGSQNTHAYDVNVGGFGKMTGFNIGHYRYKSDGFRENSDVDYAISNLITQWHPSDKLAFQLEMGTRNDEQGDLGLRFDLDKYSAFKRSTADADYYRIGSNISLSESSHILLLYSIRKSKSTDVDINELTEILDQINDVNHEEAKISETQYSANINSSTIVSGLFYANYRADSVDRTFSEITAINNQDLAEIYLYVNNFFFDDAFRVTAGADYVDNSQKITVYSDAAKTKNKKYFFPKLSARWSPDNKLELQASYMESYTKNPTLHTSLKPTHIDGSAQIFEGSSGTESENLFASIKIEPLEDLVLITQASVRDLTEPQISPGTNTATIYRNLEANNEEIHVNWLMSKNLAAGLSFTSESLSRSRDPERPDVIIPLSIKNKTIEANFNYSVLPSLNLTIELNYTEQRFLTEGYQLDIIDIPSINASEYFFTTDIDLVRTSKRWQTKISLKNLFDEDFRFADFAIFTSDPRVQQFSPRRTVFMSLNIAI